MQDHSYAELSSKIVSLLNLPTSPLAITFSDVTPQNAPAFKDKMSEPTSDGRTGRVPAGCVFWMKAAERTFSTAPEDHGNCSVGSLTHGLKTLDEVASQSDVSALVEAKWVSEETFPSIPVVKTRSSFIVYGPLADTAVNPDVVLLRVNAKQVMTLSSAVPGIRFEGKPQCHIIPMAKEGGEVAISVGCMLSRVRTGMASTEMTCAIPAHRLEEVVELLKRACDADRRVAEYASKDARRFR